MEGAHGMNEKYGSADQALQAIMTELSAVERFYIDVHEKTEEVVGYAAETTVDRNYDLSVMAAWATIDEAGSDKCISKYAHRDGYVQRELRKLSLSAFNGPDVRDRIESALMALVQFHQTQCSEVQSGADNIAQHAEYLAKRVAAAEARKKEHAAQNLRIRDRVWSITGGKCFYCDVDLVRTPATPDERPRHFHIDHIVAKEHGGPDHFANYVPACSRCNLAKRSRPFLEFMASSKAERAPLTVIEGGLSDAIKGAM